jgi:hypothetical protein
MSALPTEEQKQRAEWDLLLADLEDRAKQSRLLDADLRYRARQSFWETPRAIAMIVLAFAATFAAGGVSNWLWPSRPQTIVVQFQQPLAVKMLPP